MKRRPNFKSAVFDPRIFLAGAFCFAGLLLAALSFGALARAPSSSSSSNGNWTIVDSPNSRPTPTDNFPSGVTCVSDSDCWAVGYYKYNVSTYQTLVEHWDGTSWSAVPSPNTSPTQNNLLRSVTCASASDCWAAGSYYNDSYNQTLIEHWNGTVWTIATSPNTSDTQYNYLLGVTCVSSSDCWAVGSYSNSNGTPQTLIERWNGTAWSIVTSPNSSTSRENILNAVACTSASDCWAAGWSVTSPTNTYQTLIERWNGTSWTIVTSANTLPVQNNYLYGLTCASTSECWAVGYANNGLADQTLIERWDGSSWAIVSSPSTMINQTNRLYGVTCTAAADCWTVGYDNNGSVDQTLVEHWDGNSWSMIASPNNGTSQSNDLKGVACASATACWAVGYYFTGDINQTLTERWNGSAWTVVSSPNINAPQNDTLLGVTCVSASDCWTVASYYNGSAQQTLIQHWDGAAWTIVTSPNTSTAQSNILYDVVCPSASDCWTAGYYFTGSAWQTLIERWNGTSWSIVPSPNPGATEDTFLTNVICSSAMDCWAVGYFNNGNVYQTLSEHWDGTAWNIIGSPNTDIAHENRLSSVNCTSASDCWAVGRFVPELIPQTLIEHWDGTTWTIVTSPNTSSAEANYLNDVTCSSTSDCWTVGAYGSAGSNTGQPLIQHWDGTSWAIFPSPKPTDDPQYNYNFLQAITCPLASNCWTVGRSFVDGAFRTLIENWDGSSWNIVTSPNTSATQSNDLFGLTCVSAADCWTVGYYTDDAGTFQTLTEHFIANSPPIPTSVVSRKTHGSVGDFDIDLPLTGNPGIECRSGGATGDHTIVVTFPVQVTVAGNGTMKARVTSGSGQVGSGGNADGNAVTVSGAVVTIPLTNVTDAQRLSVTIFGVNDGTHSGDVAVPMAVLLGDVNASGNVDAADVGQVQRQNNRPLTSTPLANFRMDVNVSGNIDAADVGAVQRQNSKHL